MADALPVTIQGGIQQQLPSGDALLVRAGAAAGIDTDSAGALAVAPVIATSVTIGGATSAITSVTIGKTATDTTILGNLVVNENFSTGVVIGSGAVDLGDNSGDTISLGGGTLDIVLVKGLVGNNAFPDIVFAATDDHEISVTTSAVTVAGAALDISSATGGAASASPAGAGGAISLTSGVGGAATAVVGDTAAAGGAVSVTGAAGGAGAASVNAGAVGGAVSITGGAGGAGGAATLAGAGADVTIAGGADGADGGGGGAAGGSVIIDAGAGSSNGTIKIGETTAASITSGNATDNPLWTHTGTMAVSNAAVANPELSVSSASESDTTANYAEGIRINSTGTGAESVSIIVGDADPDGDVLAGSAGSLFLDGANGLVYVKTDNASAWTQLAAAGGNSLQAAYGVGNTIAVTAAKPIAFSNSVDATNLLTLDRTFVGAGEAMTITMGEPGDEAVTGNGVSITLGDGATGDALSIVTGVSTNDGIVVTDNGTGNGLLINKVGATGNALEIQDGGNDTLAIAADGTVTFTPTDKKAFTVDTSGTGGTISLDSTIDNINSTTTAPALSTGGDNTVSTDTAAANATGGDVFVGAINTGAGTSGGLELRAGETFGAVADGSINIVTEAPATVAGGNITITAENAGATGSTGDIIMGTVAPNATLGGVGISATQTTLSPASGEVLIESTAELDITSGDLLDINAAGGMTVDVTGSFDLLATTTVSIDGTGASNVSATSGNLTVSTITSGNVLIDAADVAAGSGGEVIVTGGTGNGANSGGDITLTPGTGGATDGPGGALNLNGGAGGATNSNGGAVVITAGAGAGTGVQGTITFDALGSAAPIPFNETGDEDLDPSFTAVSVIGAINELIASGGAAVEAEIAIENGVTITAGDTVAASTVAGRCTQMNANANAAGNFLGVARVGGTGDAGGTIFASVVMGGKVTDSGAAFAQGALYAPDGTGRPTNTAPANSGDLVFRVGFAYSATEYAIQAGEGTVL